MIKKTKSVIGLTIAVICYHFMFRPNSDIAELLFEVNPKNIAIDEAKSKLDLVKRFVLGRMWKAMMKLTSFFITLSDKVFHFADKLTKH